ncbi:hypothetical protein ENBRE01_0350 [Enteropsectra breve]|nr:hypothetical protein ENBRE01_0350 [Enteropsectra breve]
MSKKLLKLAVVIAILFIGFSLYGSYKSGCKTETKSNAQASETKSDAQATEKMPGGAHYNERYEDFVCGNFIEEEAIRYIKDYGSIAPGAKKHFITNIMVSIFLSCSKQQVEASINQNNINLGKMLKMTCSTFIEHSGNTIAKDVEAKYETIPNLRDDICPVYNKLFSQVKYEEFEKALNFEIGVEAMFNYKATIDTGSFKQGERRRVHVLDIKETMLNKDERTSLKKHLAEMRLPNPPPSEDIQWDDTTVPKITHVKDVLILYSDSAEASSIYMPVSVEIKKYDFDDKLYTYELISVIVKEGDKNDIYQMKLYPRPNGNIKKFEHVANQKGCFFMYKIK